ncbi:hypothetical protein [Persicobacter diffluens]|uniref:Uncharacterized protein n=1 Tax=Persicobacter diffluens TaxID=981 RepID=A0AAN4W3D4_9BACT|nr:hypothetical protein PEDI_54630 [Persicobacter diffluens]
MFIKNEFYVWIEKDMSTKVTALLGGLYVIAFIAVLATMFGDGLSFNFKLILKSIPLLILCVAVYSTIFDHLTTNKVVVEVVVNSNYLIMRSFKDFKSKKDGCKILIKHANYQIIKSPRKLFGFKKAIEFDVPNKGKYLLYPDMFEDPKGLNIFNWKD